MGFAVWVKVRCETKSKQANKQTNKEKNSFHVEMFQCDGFKLFFEWYRFLTGFCRSDD